MAKADVRQIPAAMPADDTIEHCGASLTLAGRDLVCWKHSGHDDAHAAAVLVEWRSGNMASRR